MLTPSGAEAYLVSGRSFTAVSLYQVITRCLQKLTREGVPEGSLRVPVRVAPLL